MRRVLGRGEFFQFIDVLKGKLLRPSPVGAGIVKIADGLSQRSDHRRHLRVHLFVPRQARYDGVRSRQLLRQERRRHIYVSPDLGPEPVQLLKIKRSFQNRRVAVRCDSDSKKSQAPGSEAKRDGIGKLFCLKKQSVTPRLNAGESRGPLSALWSPKVRFYR